MIKREFVLYSHAKTSPEINLKDLPGSTGRLDVVCRCICDALFISGKIREDTRIIVTLTGKPTPPISIMFDGRFLRKVHPDERNIAIFIGKAIKKINSVDKNHRKFSGWNESTPGIFVSRADFCEIISYCIKPRYLLCEYGRDIAELNIDGGCFILGDNRDPPPEIIEKLSPTPESISLGPISLFASQSITVVHNWIDRNIYSEIVSPGRAA